MRRPGLIGTRHSAETDRNTVPPIDGDNGQGQWNQFFLIEVLLNFFVDRVWRLISADQREGFGPSQSGPLAICEERSFAPRVQRIQTLLGFAVCTRVFRVHIDAVGAAIDL